MSVGIMDADMAAYRLVPFNLECMKISAYYKKRGDMVLFIPSFTPSRHQLFIYRKDYQDGNFPKGLTTTENVKYGGYAFSDNVYSPLPLAIEKMRPDTSLYSRMATAIGGTPYEDKVFRNMMEAEHCRISLDGKTVWSEYPSQFKAITNARNIMFHDYDLAAIDGGYETVKYIMDHARTDGWATRIGMKFPVQVSNGEDLIKWSSFKTNSTFYSLRYTGVIDDDAFLEWVGHCRDRAVFSQMEYVVTAPWYDENHFINDLLPKIFRQVIISRSYHVFFSLIYSDDYFTDKRWEKVIDLFNIFHNSYRSAGKAAYLKKIPDDTLYDFAAATYDTRRYGRYCVMTKQEIREIFAFVREYNYPLFKDFYECNFRSLGGLE